MQRISLYFLMSLMMFGCLFITPMPAKAYSPVVAECNANVNHTNGWIDIWADQVKQLIDVRLDHYYLDGVAARLYAADGQDAQVTVQVKNRDGTTISALQGGVTIGANPTWYYFDMPDAALPRATYYVEIGSYTGHPYWNYTSDSNCIDDSYAVINGDNRGFSVDMGFAVYAYDSSQSSNPPDNSNPSSSDQMPTGATNTTNSSTSSTSPSTNKSTGTSATKNQPSDSEIISMLGLNKHSSGVSIWSYIFPILFILFIISIPVIIIIWMVVINRRKKGEPVGGKEGKDPGNKT